MHYDEETIPLKNGKSARLRAPREEDAGAMLDFIRRAVRETDYLALTPAETDAYTVESEADFLRDPIRSPNKLMIVAEVDGRVVGNCQLIFMSSEKTRHRAAVMIGLLREFWGLGIGSAMFAEMERVARERGGIRQLELEVIEGNERAMGLYRKMGFTVMAEHPDAFRLSDGSSHAAIFMRKVLE